MTVDELDRQIKARRAALDQMQIACAGALGLLSCLRKYGYIPEHHQESADLLIAKYEAHRAAFDALTTPTEPA